MGNSPKGEYMLKKRIIFIILGIGLFSLFLLGCSRSSFLLTEEENQEMKELTEGQQSAPSQIPAEQEVILEETVSFEKTENDSSLTLETENRNEIAVHICGAVKNPGVYFLESNQRIYHAIDAAGGITEDADGDYINQALLLEDGMKIVIPTKEEVKQWSEEKKEEKTAPKGSREENQAGDSYIQYADSDFSGKISDADGEKNSKVNLNTADETLLCTLPGIGPSRAKSILDYRTKNGNFKTIEDVMKVSGIKEAAFEKIKDYICISD